MLKLVSIAGALGFAIAAAITIGERMNEQTVSVLAGAICGISASIPTSLLIVWLTTRRREPEHDSRPGRESYPPVVVVQPPPHPGNNPSFRPGYMNPYPDPAPRQFKIVGGDVGDFDDDG
jgi:hypothetical protein